MAETPTQFFFNAIEIVVAQRGLTVKKAEKFVKDNLAKGTLSLVDENGQPVTTIQFTEQLAKIE